MTDEERVRKQLITRRSRRGVIATGMVGTLGVTGLVATQASTEAASTVTDQTSTTSGTSTQQQWNVAPPGFGSNGTGSPHAATGGS